MLPNFTILVNSSDGFEDCWSPFFSLFKKYWKNCTAPIFLNTERKQWACPGIDIHCTQVQETASTRLPWSECLIKALDQIKTPLVLYFQEDYFIHQDVRTDIVQSAVDYMMDNPEIEHIALTQYCSHGPYTPHTEEWLQVIRQDARYRICTQAGLWRVEALKSYLRAEENGWMFEIFGTWRAQRKQSVFLSAKFDEDHGGPAIDYLHTGIIKGRWLYAIQAIFSENEISVDYSRRGFYTPKPPLLHKFDLGFKLMHRPIYFIKQYFGW